MTTIYTGSNYGVISLLNSTSVSTSLASSATSTFATYELVRNYTAASILLQLTGASTSGYCNVLIDYSNDGSGTIVSTETHNYINYTTSATTSTIQFKPQGAYCRIRLYNGGTGSVNFEIQTRFNNSNDPDNTYGVISSGNSFNFTSSPSLPFTGVFEDISQTSLITFLINGTSASPPISYTLEGIFSSDGINEDRIVTYTIQDASANGSTSSTTSLTFNPAHTLLPIAKYFKARVTSISGTATSLRFTTTYHTNKSKPLTSRATQSLTDQFDADTARAILVGRTLGTILPQGHYQNIGVQNQSLATYIRDPATAFGELLSAQLTPLMQYDFSNGEPYEVMLPIIRNETTKSSYTYSNAFLNLTVGTSPAGTATNSYILSESAEYTKYKPGQGTDMRMTAVFDSTQPTSGCDQFVGLYTPENSFTFGYFTSTGVNYGFGIRYGRGGLEQIVNISVSGTSSATGTISVTFGATIITTASLASGSSNYAGAAAITNIINSTANLNTYGWTALYYTSDGGTTYVVQASRRTASSPDITVTAASPQNGFTITTSTARSGVSTTYQYISQNSWNIDRCKDQGSLQQNYLYNPTGFQLDPTKGNVYRITMQYLGFGAITFYVENPTTGSFIPVHQIQYANSSSTNSSVSSPNFRLTYGVENTTYGGTITLKACSLSCFTQGMIIPAPLYRSYPNNITGNTVTSISKANSRVVFAFRVLRTKTSTNSDASTSLTINRSNLFFNSISTAVNVAVTGNNVPRANITFQLVKNPTQFYVGDPSTTVYYPNWRQYEKDSTIIVFDGSATTSTSTGIGYTGGLNVFDLPLVDNSSFTYDMRDMLVNASAEDTYLVSYFGTTANVTSFDVLAAISYQINN